jgi:hypothetical protein
MSKAFLAVIFVLSGILSIGCASKTTRVGDNKFSDAGWPAVHPLTRPWARWWWLGSAVDEKNLNREMTMLKEAGIGGVEITPLYGATGYESRYIEFLSPKFMDMLEYAGETGKRLNFGVDMATGTGWPFGGGPVVTPDIADTKVELTPDGKLRGVPTEMKVKRAAPGDEGWVLDPYSVDAISKYLAWFDKPFSRLPKGLITGQFHDSFEYMGNWTDELPDRFKQMHGYDINDHARELFGQGDPDTVARVKSDYRETLAALHYDYVKYWVDWCHKHGFEARNQAHGAPGNLLDLYAVADVPETETFGSTPFTIPGFRRDPNEIASNGNGPNPTVTRFATSAQHVMGRDLSSCETLTWLREHFKVAPTMIKPELDQMFLAGINHILYHGTCYSPEDAPWPGWLFYASSEINPRDTLWTTMPAVNQYITRVQSVLQSGSPDNDVLVYFPFYDHLDKADGMEIFFKVNIAPPWLVGTQTEKTSLALTDMGYSWDMISDMQLEQTKNAGTDLKVPGGNYRVLLVPPTGKMPLETLQRIMKLADGGATVIFTGNLPKDVPGLAHLDRDRAAFKALLEKLQFSDAGNGVRTAKLGRGRVMLGDSMDAMLQAANVRRETLAGQRVELIRRKHDQGYHYFIASLGTRSLDGWTRLAVNCESAVMLDPLTGKTGVVPVRKGANGAEVYLQLKPGESLILRTFNRSKAQGGAWTYLAPAGDGTALSGTWQVDFLHSVDPKAPMPPSYKTDTLKSWTEQPDDEYKKFAGTARYTLTFDRPAGVSGPATLNLGDVREVAKVRLNGKDLGTAWALPLEVSVDQLQPTGNKLELEVTNLTSNRIRDLDIRKVNWRYFREINYVNINYQPFDASGWSIAPSGLLGPVKLVPMKTVEVQQ